MKRFQKISESFAARTLRERVGTLLAGLLLIGYGGWMMLVAPLFASIQQLETRHTHRIMEIDTVQAQISELKAASSDPDAPLNNRIAALLQQQDVLNQRFLAQSSELIPASRMKEVLQQLLAQHNELKLVALYSLPPRSMLDAEMSTEDISLYQQSLVLVVEGRYFAIQAYLQHIQSLPWRFYWQEFDYKVTEYPLAQLHIQLYTLSTGKAFVGV
ncbi:hypothetical protein GCM10009092_42760 [Bowmanella denitrificans]|uniref:MSHA biogenesis protein MshJ n=1 Tax=Bowmanella denitrificans TaxID=366582 RepID=A0ABP3HPN4_9ALTE